MIPWKLIAGGVAAVAVVATAYGLGYSAAHTSVSYEWEQDRLARAEAVAALENKHRAAERRWNESLMATIDWHRTQREGVEREYQDTIADLESGAVRLRGDLAGCRDRVPENTPAPGGDTGGDRGGLSESRQRVALRIGRDADLVVARLGACQSYVRGILDLTETED